MCGHVCSYMYMLGGYPCGGLRSMSGFILDHSSCLQERQALSVQPRAQCYHSPVLLFLPALWGPESREAAQSTWPQHLHGFLVIPNQGLTLAERAPLTPEPRLQPLSTILTATVCHPPDCALSVAKKILYTDISPTSAAFTTHNCFSNEDISSSPASHV